MPVPAHYDPEEYGARCGECPLRGCREGKPIPPESTPGAQVAAIGAYPGATEVADGRPWVGAAGMVATRGFYRAGVARDQVHWTNVLLCRPPHGDLRSVLLALRATNKRRAAAGEPQLPTPSECCAPRLANELARVAHLIPMGTEALHATTTVRQGIQAVRGTMMTTRVFGRDQKVLPTFNPAAVVYKGRLRPVFYGDVHEPVYQPASDRRPGVMRGDLDLALRYFREEIAWKDADTIYIPSPQQLEAFIAWLRPHNFAVVDTETDALEPLTAKLRCVQISDLEGTRAVVVPFLGIDGTTQFYAPGTLLAMRQIMARFLADSAIVKVGHNLGYYDQLVVGANFGVEIAPLLDTLLVHRLTYSELPHNLGFVGSTLSTVVAWKAGKIATNAGTDGDLWLYGARDVVVNGRVTRPLLQAFRQTGQRPALLDLEHDMQRICVGMHRNGIAIDQGLEADGKTPRPEPTKPDKTGAMVPDEHNFGRIHWETKLRREADQAAGRLFKLVGDPNFRPGFDDEDLWDEQGEAFDAATAATIEAFHEDASALGFNPGSADQLRHKLFGRPANGGWGLQPLGFTATGDPSTGDDVLRAMMLDATIPSEYRVAIREVRKFRGAIKLLGYIKGVRNEPGVKGCHLLHDGALHANWNATGRGSGDDGATTTGRLTSSPNTQNWRHALRSVFVARPGHLYVDADFDQVELRLVAAIAQCAAYLEILRRAAQLAPNHPDGDPHRLTMQMIFGAAALTCEGQPVYDAHTGTWSKGSGQYKEWRDLAKRFLYAVLYGAEAPTMHRVITSAEDDRGRLLYDPAEVTVRKIKVLRTRWLASNPEIERWWKWTQAKFEADGYLEEPVTGRRRFFGDGMKFNELVNFRVQASAAGLCNLAAVKIHAALPTGFGGPGTGLIGQFHDALALEVPERDAPECARLLTEAMTQTHPALRGVEFTAVAGVGRRLSLV